MHQLWRSVGAESVALAAPPIEVTKARGHFPTDDAVVKLLYTTNSIEDKRARERAARRQETGKRSDQPGRMVEGQRVMGWREALNELDTAYPGRMRWNAA